MRPIAHAHRPSSREASPRHAVDAVVGGKPALAQFTGRVLDGNANWSQSRDDFLLEQTRASLLRLRSRRSPLRPAT
jgi:hypothetical protein